MRCPGVTWRVSSSGRVKGVYIAKIVPYCMRINFITYIDDCIYRKCSNLGEHGLKGFFNILCAWI